LLVPSSFVPAQDISFFHLNTSNGLSDNLVAAAVRDKHGILWVGTGEGINSYDGYTVKKYFKEDYPGLSSNNILSLVMDDEDRIWVRDINGKITLIDEKRNFIPVKIMDEGKEITALTFFKTKQRGLCIVAGSKIFVSNKQQPQTFEKLKWKEDTALVRGYVQIKDDNNDTVIVLGPNRLVVFDIRQLKVLHSVYVPNPIGAAWLNDNEVLVTTGRDRELLKVDLNKKAIVHNYGNLKDQYGQPINGYLRHMRKLPGEKFIMTSGYAGVYIFDALQEKFYRYGHDPLNVQSISANNTAHVFTDSSGYVFITSRTAGLSYFNYKYHFAGYRSSFQETATGKIFHGFINYITRHKNGNYWMGTQNGLIEWNREMNTVWFRDYGAINNEPLNGVEEVRALCFDKNDNLWVGLNRYGIVVLDKTRRPIKYFSRDKKRTPDTIPGNWINNIVLSPDNKIWVSSAGGLVIINPETFTIERFDEKNVLAPLGKIHTFTTWFRNPYEVWIGNTRGAYRYRLNTHELTSFNTDNGLTNNSATCFAEDRNGIIYIGTLIGLNLVKGNGVIKNYKRNNGLSNDYCSGMLSDAENNIWIGNDNVLLRYNHTDSSFAKYDERSGLNPSGFRSMSYYQSADGEQVWGSDAGISYFRPDDLNNLVIPFKVQISSLTAGAEQLKAEPGKKIPLHWSQNNLQFSFSAIDLFSNKNIIYEYKLDGADKDWKKTFSPQEVAYTHLSPGSYTFQLRASKDGNNWIEASNPVTVTIKTPWWRSTAFIVLYVLLIAAVIYYFFRSRSNKIKEQREELETEQAINYFATSMTGQGTVDDTLWDVARNCISRLGFEDCVIYLLDENKKVLIQKAAWGPKTTLENKILNPIEIPVGRGIVGNVALTGKAELINDTSKDERYIVDDVRRWSEIAVPIISNNKVLGVIDSEHSKKHFFTQHHFSILTTIASLCANKIVRAKAEEEKLKAETSLVETERQTAEMEMQALRAQMNPHFMFNSLNSINNFILKNDPDNASQYLTRFSRLMRLILDNSREEWVLLENELKALQLYIEMEAIRFDNVFDYKISMALDVNPSSVIVPPMIVQPYVENAIWHGLLHRKEAGSKLQIDIWKNNGELFIKIEDNGVGREEAEHLKSKFSSHKKSHGMKITAKRLDMVNKIYKVDAKVKIDDLKNGSDKSAGTSVLLQLKYKTSHND
jgi:ligand-binding sensor domain-containing protein/putative methionine-R-sulfoxide reductase with GAF domain